MSQTPSELAYLSASQLARIEQDALRGIGASSGDTLRLVSKVGRYKRDPLLWVDTMFNIIQDQQSAMLVTETENTRLRNLLAEKIIDSTMLTGLTQDDDGMTFGFEGGACGMMAEAFGEQLFTHQVENYIEASFSSGKYPDLGQITVTVKRETGKTPHQLRTKAETESRALAYLLQYLVENEHNAEENQSERHMMVTEAETLLSFVAGDMESHTLVPDSELMRICGKTGA